jgi:hypothetical protein
MGLVATITYNYGASNNPDNRQIDFIRTGGAGTLQARITVVGQPTAVLGVIPENKIIVEMESTTQKMNRMIAERNHQPFNPPPSPRLLSTFPNTTVQDGIITSINANSTATGGRRISITNGPAGQYGETVVGLRIIDPR